jgi:hypothetical protein
VNSVDRENRELLGIHFCPTCGEDTMPCERTGMCFFCDRQILAVAAKPVRRAA